MCVAFEDGKFGNDDYYDDDYEGQRLRRRAVTRLNDFAVAAGPALRFDRGSRRHRLQRGWRCVPSKVRRLDLRRTGSRGVFARPNSPRSLVHSTSANGLLHASTVA